MKHLPELEQPAFAPETEGDVYQLEWLARDILFDEDLWLRIKAHRKTIVDVPSKVSALVLQGTEADKLLGGLSHVKDTFPRSHHRYGPVAHMITSYEASLAAAQAAPVAPPAPAELVAAA